MQPKRIGPIPLLQGLQLDPPVGKPGGLLDVRNMEARNGHLATRRGLEYRGQAGVDLAAVSVSANVMQPGTNWDGQTAGYLGYQTLVTVPGKEMRLSITAPSTANTVEADKIELSYSVAAATYKPLPFVWDALQDGKRIVLAGDTGASETIRFVCPDDWAAISQGGTTAYWLRIRFINQDGSVASIAGWVHSGATAHSLQYAGNNTETVDALWAPFRSRSRVISAHHNVQDDSIVLADWGSRVWDGSLRFAETSALHSNVGLTEWPDVSMVYVPSIDQVLVATDGVQTPSAPFGLRSTGGLSGSAETLSNLDVAEGVKFPEVSVDDTAWQDVAVESNLGPVAALGLFNERVFIGGAGELRHTVRWSAPSEFARIVPSTNLYRLVGGGGGDIVGFATVHRTLYIFTSTAIWSVHEVEPIEGEDSRMIFNVVEETGCVSKRSIAVVNGAVFFLAPDGVRVFNGQTSRVITADVEDLFRADAEHPLACRVNQARRSAAVFDPVERLYVLGYQTADGQDGNDAALVINVDTGACFLWGEEWPGYEETTDATAAVDGRVGWGYRMQAACWDAAEQRMWRFTRLGLASVVGGSDDMGMGIPWSFETHHVGLGDRNFQLLREIDLELERISSNVSLSVSAIKEGRLALKDTRTLTVDRGGALSTDAKWDDIDANGDALAEVENSYVPMKWRGANRGTNHRVLVESVQDDSDWLAGPHPVKVAALSLTVLQTGRR